MASWYGTELSLLLKIMSLNPINEINESPRSTINSLSTSTTSSASSFSHLRAPISTSLPSYSSSASTYVGPNSVTSERTERTERTTTETGTSNTPTSTDGVWNNPLQQQNQTQNLPFIPQIYRTTRATSFSSRNTSSSSMTNSTLGPQMERSHSTSTMYSLSSTTFHEKSLSGGSIPYTPSSSSISHHKMNQLYDTSSVTSKELEKMEQSGQQHDTWGSLAVKVLPLFNGEGLKLSIEDLNELVR